MKLSLVLFGTLCLLGRIQSQGFIPPQLDPAQPNLYRRQLTPIQQSHILSDIQQHQHRFNLHPQQQQPRPFPTQQQPNLDGPIGPGSTQQALPNQRPQPANPIRFPQNNFRSNFGGPNQPIVQHHTQTNFIPNFVQQPQQNSKNFQHQRSLQNQLHVPQQPFQPDFPPQGFGSRNQFISNRGNPQQPQQSVKNPQFAPPQGLPQFVPQFQNGPQNIQPFQQNPQIQFDPSLDPNQQFQGDFQVAPRFQTAPQFNPAPTFQTATQLQPATQFQTTPHFQTAPQFLQVSQPDPENLKLIQKHEAFVQKQYEKQQNKVRQLHDEFIQKQQTIKESGGVKKPINLQEFAKIAKSRGLLASEVPLFEQALRKYYEEHPVATTTTTTTTPRTVPKSKNSAIDQQFELLLKAQREDIYNQLKQETHEEEQAQTKGKQPLANDDLLKQLKLALAEAPQPSLGNKTYDSMDLVLPNGQTVQVIRTTDPNLIKGQNAISAADLSKVLKQETGGERKKKEDTGKKLPLDVAPLTSKDLVLPNGKKVEIVRAPDPNSIGGLTSLPADIASLYGQNIAHTARVVSSDGPPSLEELAKQGLIPEGFEIAGVPGSGSGKVQAQPTQPPTPSPKKKATYVYLEEQPDGSFKIQGVKANGEKETKTSGAEVESILERIKSGDIKLPPTVKKISLPEEEESAPRILNKPSTRITTPRPITTQERYTTPVPRSSYSPTSPRPVYSYSTLPSLATSAGTSKLTAASSNYQTTSAPPSSHAYFSSVRSSPYSPITEKLVATSTTPRSDPSDDLIQILKQNGLYAMAKYLKQSGLDNILNETGPYTVFAPTDKAFKSLLVQLGGPERAEEKFKSSPRLLSGLLLHHVIPGSFEISALQDEMTGVSLAGTQLRVNQYSMHDDEWNDVLTTTINGAMVVPDKQDIKIPQGVAHGIDVVMFPLPVGDLLQTLQSDRERRFGTFLKVLFASGMSELLQNKGTKTYTVFAPTDKAFSEFDPEELDRLISDKDAAQAFAMKHITPGTLFSAGMRFYQVKDSLIPGKSITLQKTNNGKIKVNESLMITSNIPATNGVIHALESLL